jgi:hypothetical protein
MNSNRSVALVCGILLTASLAFCQTAIPRGTVLPVELNSSLSSKMKPGAKVTGRIMQKVPLGDGQSISRGAKVIGHVVAARAASDGTPGQVTLRFDRLVTSRRNFPIITDLRAIAGFMAVNEAQIPPGGPDRATPEVDWTTQQIGGDIVYRGGGAVTEGFRTVGEPVNNGVLVHVRGNSAKCRAGIYGNNNRQALWVFSADACGAYGLPGLVVVHAGRSSPVGDIIVAAQKGKLELPGGAGMLLRVIGTGYRAHQDQRQRATGHGSMIRPAGRSGMSASCL